MRKLQFLCSIILLNLYLPQVSGQKIDVGIFAGYANYQLNDLKQLQSELQSSVSGFELKETESFPAYVYFSISSSFRVDSVTRTGVVFVYLTTGARNNVKDYSGQYVQDLIINGYRIGAFVNHDFIWHSKWEAGGQLSLGSLFSDLDVEESLQLFDSSSGSINADYSEKTDLTGFSLYVEPSLFFNYKLMKRISIQMNVGFEIDLPGELHLKGNRLAVVQKSDGNNVVLQWMGIRTNFGLTYSF